MSYKDKYKNLSDVYGNSIREVRVNNTKWVIADTFKDSPSYYHVLVSTPSTPLNEAFEMDLQIVDNSETRDEKIITTYYDNSLAAGHLVYWLDEYWLTVHADVMSEIYKKGVIRECYSSLKWQDSDGEIREAWFTRKSETIDVTGVAEGRIISLPDENRQIIVQSNSYTQEFKKYDRFIFSNRAWKIVSLDDLADGIITIVLQEDEINPAVDRVDLRIANYIEPDDDSGDDNTALDITGSESIYFGRSAEYSVVSDDNLTFSLTADDGVSSTSLASITSQSSNACTLLAGNKSGYVKLHVQDLGVKRIQIKSLY